VHYLDQPRAVKRLLTQVDAFWGEVAGEAMIKERSPRNPRAVGAVLAEMFLVLRSARENMTYDSEYKDDVRRRSGVGSAEFFDRYIQLGMLANDLPDKLVATAIVPILGQHYLRACDQQSGLFGSAGGHQMRGLARRILDRCDGPEGVELLTDLTRHGPSSLRLASDIVRGAKSSDDDRDVVRPWLDAAADVVAEALEAELRGAAGKRLNESPEITGQLYAYRHLVGDETARALLWELLEGPVWTLEELLGSLIPVGTSSNGRRTWQSMGDFYSGDVEAFLGLDRVIEQLGPALDGPSKDWSSVHELQDAEADLPARTVYAFASLRRLRDERARGTQTPADS